MMQRCKPDLARYPAKLTALTPSSSAIAGGVLYRILAMGHAEFLIQIADMRFDGGCRDFQFSGNLLIAVTRVDQPQYLPFTLRQRAGADQFRYFRTI